MLTPVSIVVGMLARGDLHVCRRGGRQSVAGILAGVRIASTHDPCSDGCDWVERDRRRRGAGAFGEGKAATLTESLRLMMCRSCPASAATSARGRARTPR